MFSFVRVQKKISKAVEILEYFTTKDWEFTNDNFLALMNSMNDHDKKEFYLDIRPLNWKTYIEQYCLGAKIHLLKEDISNVEYCRRKLAK
jgi:fatty acyl-CoA reductase